MKDRAYHIIMISTGDDAALFQELISSLELNQSNTRILLIVVNQGLAGQVPHANNLELKVIEAGQKLSLSAARNLGLKYLFQEELLAVHLMFPDDDTTFDALFFERYQHLAKAEQAYLGRVLGKEDYKNYKAYPNTNNLTGKTELLPYVASVSMLIPFEVAKKTGYFDEQLGAGATWASSEDLDYYLRCAAHTRFIFKEELYNLHPSRFGKYNTLKTEQIKRRFKGYTDGYLFVMFRYDLEKQAKNLPYRAMAGALVSMAKGAFRLVPIYFWLARYRFKMLRFFKAQKKQNPQFFALS